MPQEFVNTPVNRIRAGTDRRINDGARTAAKLCRIRVRLNLEFLQRFNRRLDDLNVLAPVGARIRDVINPVEKKRVVERAVPVHVDCALEV